MKFNTCTGITWSLLELTGLLEDEDSHVCFEKTKKHLGLHPFHLTNLQTALNEILSSGLNVYDAELKGFLIAYKNPKLLTPLGEILYDTCFIHIDIEVDFYIFRPQVGCSLKGIVNKKGLSHIGLLVHKAFNVSIPKPDDSNDWPGDKVDIGQEVRCTVTHLDCTSKLPFIRGSLSEEDYLYGCKIFKSNIDDILHEDDILNETVHESNESNVDEVSPSLQNSEDPQYAQELSCKINNNKNGSNTFYEKNDQKEKKRSKKSKIGTDKELITTLSKSEDLLINSSESLQNNGNELHKDSSDTDQHENSTAQINNHDKIKKDKKKSVTKCLQESRLSDTEDNNGEINKTLTVLHDERSKETTKLKKGSKRVKISIDSCNDKLENNNTEGSQNTVKKQTKRPILINSPFRETNSKSVKSSVSEEPISSTKVSGKSRLSNLNDNCIEDKSQSETLATDNVSSNTKKRSRKNTSPPSEEHIQAETSIEKPITYDESTLPKKRSKKHKFLEEEEDRFTTTDIKTEQPSISNSSSKKQPVKSTLVNAVHDLTEAESARSLTSDVSSPQKRSKKAKLLTDNTSEVKVKHKKLLTNDESESLKKRSRKSRSPDLKNSFTDVEIKSEKISQESSHSSEKHLRESEWSVYEEDPTNVNIKSEKSLTSDESKPSKKRVKKSVMANTDESGTSLPGDRNTPSKKRPRKSSSPDVDNLQGVEIKSEEPTDEWNSAKKRQKISQSLEGNEIYSEKIIIKSENLPISEESDSNKKRSRKSRVNDRKDNPENAQVTSEEAVANKELSSSKKRLKKSRSPEHEQTYSEVRIKSEKSVVSDECEFSKKRSRKTSMTDQEGNDVETETHSKESLAASEVSMPKKRSMKSKISNSEYSFSEVRVKTERPTTSDESDSTKTKSQKSRVVNFNDRSVEDVTNLENSVNSKTKSSKKGLRKSMSPVPEENSLPRKLSSDLDGTFAEVRIKSEKSPVNDESETSKKRSKKNSFSNMMDNHTEVKVKLEPVDGSLNLSKKGSRIVETPDDDTNFAEVTVKSESSLLNDVSNTPKKRSKKSKTSVVADDFADIKIKSEK